MTNLRRELSRLLLPSLLLLFFGNTADAQFTLDREPPGPSSRKTGLAITEIMYNPRPVPGLATNLTLEFIELYNSKPWDEDLGGYTIDGMVRYVIPSNTVLRAGGYLVVARVPELIQTNYGIANVIGPWDGAATNRLSTEGGLVQLRNRQGAVLLQVDYMDSPPWPEAADGTGHSLALVRPSYGENDYRAWAESDSVGGSPGGPDPVTHDPLASVFINEWQNHSDPVDWVELYNHANTPVDISGAYLSDDPATNLFRIPNGTIIPARGFMAYDQNQLGFQLFAGGETIFFWSSNRTRVIDVIDFRGQSNNITSGRWPDGGPIQYGLSTPSRGQPNNKPMRYGVVINEIMYNPISGSNDDEYLEIYNRGSRAADLTGWALVVGVNYTFPTNAITLNMPAGAYWVLAKNPTNLLAIYTNLNTNIVFGPYSGTLANGGERITLAAADYDMVPNPGGGSTIEKLPVPVSDLIYGDGGTWTVWSDGRGSSLELIDPEADVHHPSNWADSNDTGESKWTSIEMNVPLGESLGPVINDRLIVMLEGIGECLLDEVEVRVDNGPNLLANGGFESGLEGWSLQGSHDFSTIENEGFAGSKSLHLRAGSRGDNQSNRLLSPPFPGPIPPTAGRVSLRAKARWLRGSRDLLLRLHGSATEAYGRMAVPRLLGTPGAPNSRRVANAGPALYDVKHAPLLPAADEPVVVTARAIDPQGVASLTLRYRVDPEPAYTDLLLADTGTAGDAVANDGIFSATIPAQAAGVMVACYVEGRDTLGAVGTFPKQVFPEPGFTRCWPNDAVARECVVRWDEVQMPGDFATYHLWVTAANSNRWHTRDPMNNAEMDGTFVYNQSRVIYNALPLYSGSPWHRTNSTTGPAGPNRVDYEMNFPDDDAFLGSTDFVLNNSGNPDVLTISDHSAMTEQTAYEIFEGMGLPHNHRRYIHFFVNGSQRSTAHERPGNFIFEDSQQPNGEVIEEWFPNDAGGQLFKVEDWFEFEPNGFDLAAHNDADLARRTVLLNGQPTLVAAPYRYMFRRRSGGGASEDDYASLFALIDAVSPAENPTNAVIDPVAFGAVADWEAWMRFFALERAVGNWDSFGWARGKNDYLYRSAGGFVNLPWDIDYGLGLGRPANEPLFESNDPRVRAMFNTPEIVRAYWRAFADLVDGPFSNAHLDPFLDARATALVGNQINIDLEAVAGIKTYIRDRQAFLRSQLETVAAPFAVAEPLSFSTTNNLLVLHGTAPVTVKQVALNGALWPITWTTVTNFELRVILSPGVNALTLEGLDRFGAAIAGVSQGLSVDYTGPVADPAGSLIISEILFAAGTPGAQFIEILNRSALNFDLTGWRLDGAGLTFPISSIVTNGQTIVLARDRAAFRSVFGSVPVFATFGTTLPSSRGQTLALVRPGTLGDELIDVVRYEVAAPWPGVATGASLQLIDAAQDNARVSNWAVDALARATPGASNSVAATLPPYDPLWLNEVQLTQLTGLVDNLGDPDPWLELYNAGPLPLNLEGYFLADNYGSNLTQWPFPAGAFLEPGEHRLIWIDGEPEESVETNLHANFRIQGRGKLALVRLVDAQPQITDYLTWPWLGANLSYGSFPEGQAVFRTTLHEPTPSTANTTRAWPLFINEYMARNTAGIRDPADLEFDDWFELYNAGAQTLDLGGFYLTDNASNPTKFLVPTNGQYRIPSGGFLLVWADDEASQNNGSRIDLHAGFQLSSSAGIIALYAPDGQTLVDSVVYGLQTTNTSEGRYSDGANVIYPMIRPTPRGINSLLPDYNTPPRFPALTNAIAIPGQTLTVQIRASDPDTNTLTYALKSGPAGSFVLQTGFFRWIVPTNQPAGDYLATLTVTDNGTPARSDGTTVAVTVRAPSVAPVVTGPLIHSVACPNGQATFMIDTIPGRTYRVFYTDDLGAPAWTQLGPDFVAANVTASITDLLSAPQRFYRVAQTN